MSNCIEVRVTADDVIHGGRLLKPNDLVKLDSYAAERLVQEGRATYTVRVEALTDGLLNGTTVMNKGDRFETSPERASFLQETGAARVLDIGKLPAHLRKPLGTLKTTASPAPAVLTFSDEDPATHVKLLEETFWGSQTHPRGAVLTVSAQQAKVLVDSKRATLTVMSSVATVARRAVKAAS